MEAKKSSVEKRQRQNLKRHLRNQMIKSKVKTYTKYFLNKVGTKEKEEAENIFKELSGLIDKATRKGVYHKNNAARKKSRLQKILNRMET